MTNEASISPRIVRLPGRSVRAVSHAMGAPIASEASPTQKAITTVFQSAFRSWTSVNAAR